MYDLPEQFSEFGEARQKGFLAVKEVKEQGGRVAGVFCTFTPYEILDAAGFLPVSLCGMSDEVIPAAIFVFRRHVVYRRSVTTSQSMICHKAFRWSGRRFW